MCHPKNYNIGLLAYSPLAGGSLSGKYLDINSEAAKKGRFNLFPGYMERYNKSFSKVRKDATPLFMSTIIKYFMPRSLLSTSSYGFFYYFTYTLI